MDDSSTRFDSARDDFEDAIHRFEVAWQGRVRPEILAHLPTGPGRTRLLAELVHVDLEYRVRAGEAVRVEDYLTRYPELADSREIALDLIAAEFELRRRGEPGLDAAAYVRRFPQYGRELADRIAAGPMPSGTGRDMLRRPADSRRD